MIVSFSNNFIFIKTAKTASSSVEQVLGAWCSDPDILTPLKGVRSGQNNRGFLGRRRFRAHESAVVVRRKLPDLWASAFKFSVERHPYEMAVSNAYWRVKDRRDPAAAFPKMLESVIRKGRYHNRRRYEIGGEVVVDELINYDNLWPRLAELAAGWGRTLPDKLPRIHASDRLDRRPAHEILNDRQKAAIYRGAQPVFERFGFAP